MYGGGGRVEREEDIDVYFLFLFPFFGFYFSFFVSLFNFSQLDAYLKAVGKLYHPSTWRDRISLSSHKQ